jgi:hypothetical protein
VVLLKTKAEKCQAVKETLTRMEIETGDRVMRTRTDRGLEYVNQVVDRWLKEKNVLHETTVGYSPQSNRAAERLNVMMLSWHD